MLDGISKEKNINLNCSCLHFPARESFKFYVVTVTPIKRQGRRRKKKLMFNSKFGDEKKKLKYVNAYIFITRSSDSLR